MDSLQAIGKINCRQIRHDVLNNPPLVDPSFLVGYNDKKFLFFRNAALQREFYAVQTFLSACCDGPFVTLLNRLIDVYPLFEYPATQLPITTQYHSNQGNVLLNAFEFYFYHFFNLPLRRQNLYQSTNQNNATDSLYPILVEDYLNAYLPVDSANQSKLFAQNPTPSGSFHHQMQELQHQQNKAISNFDPTQAINSSPPSARSTLLRKDFSFASIQAQHNQDISTIGTSFPAPSATGIGQQTSPLIHNRISKGETSEIWRSETFAKILIAFWIESYVSREAGVNNQNSGHLTHPNTYSTPLPSSELLRCIRMFIKHAHYFANACKEGGPYIPSSLRFGADLFSSYGGISGSSYENSSGGHVVGNNKVLYAFFALCIDHWPLDASFRLVLETWLSYIQPWRYTQLNMKGSANMNNDSGDPIDSTKWATFVDENFRFYTNMFGKLLSARFSRLDISSHKNAYMLFRIAKVYSQENLINILYQIFNMQGRSMFQSLNTSASPTRHAAMAEESAATFSPNDNVSPVPFFKDNDQGLSSHPVDLLGLEFKELVSSLLLAMVNAKQAVIRTRRIAESLNKSHAEKEKSIGFPSRLIAFIADVFGLRNVSRPSSPGSSGMDPAEKIESDKTLQYLDFCMEKFSSLFELENIMENLKQQNLSSKVDPNVTDSLRDCSSQDDHEQASPNCLSPIQRRDILLKKVKVYTKYDGNPDRVPIRSDEFRFLVRILLCASGEIDKRWRSKIEDWYNRRPGFAYVIFRQICTPPCIYRSSGNEILEENSIVNGTLTHPMNSSYCGSLRRYNASSKRRLPARIVLRPLASYKFIFYISVSYIFLVLIWQKSVISSTFYICFFYTLWLIAKAMTDFLTGEDGKAFKDNTSSTPIDFTLDATILSQDESY